MTNEEKNGKHTPGPWLTIAFGDRVKVVSDAGRSGFPVADVAQGYDDARLVAAAPELLEALATLEAAACDRLGVYHPAIMAARAAVAKAEGADLADQVLARAEGRSL